MMGRHFLYASLWVVGGLLGQACVERAPQLSPADRERLSEYVGTEASAPEHELNVTLDNGVRLIGYDVSVETARPGQPFTVTWHWQATQNLDEGWQLFTHVADSTGESRFNQDGVGVVREIYQPGRWRAGQYIRDEQEITLPDDWSDNQAVFFLGIWNGPHRLAVRTGEHDAENRIRALELPVAGGPSASLRLIPALPAAPASGADNLTIDGDLTEFTAAARETRGFVNTLTGGRNDVRASAWALWDEDNLYVAWRIADRYIVNPGSERDAHLWEHDAFEIMIDPDGDGRDYFEMQVSPTGQLFDTRYDTRRQPQPIGHVDWNPEVQVAVQVDGTVNAEGDDEGWRGEIAIPWGAFGSGVTAPSAGDTWRVNFYVMDEREGDEPAHSAGWSATLEGDFHVPARFGRVTFEGPQVAAAEGAGGAPSRERRPAALAQDIQVARPIVQLNPQLAHRVRINPANLRLPAQRQLELQQLELQPAE